jgi:hypothetical protein
MPVLVIDDEADLASINTKSNRPLDPAVGDDDDEDEKLAPSRTNALIRSILKRSPRSVYVAYTATPFANIFINPDAVDRRVGDDLFPRDFVFQLPRPKGYTGTEELFGESARDREVLRPVPRRCRLVCLASGWATHGAPMDSPTSPLCHICTDMSSGRMIQHNYKE